MTFTSDERHEVARRLRNNKTTSIDCNSCKIISRALYGYDSAVCNRCEQVARDGYAVPDSCEGEGFGRLLADLIDRPTCQMKSIPTSSYRVCSSCGAFVRKDAVTNCTEAIPVRFCPNCDAMVVEKEENDGKR